VLKGTASAVPQNSSAEGASALPKAGVKRAARNDRSAFLSPQAQLRPSTPKPRKTNPTTGKQTTSFGNNILDACNVPKYRYRRRGQDHLPSVLYRH
jgi:hypothetical protein